MTISIPTNSQELGELLSDNAKLTEIQRDGKLGDVIKAYAAAVAKRDIDITKQVHEQVQTTMVEFLRENKVTGGTPVASTTKVQNKGGALYSSKAAGASVDQDYDGTASYFRTIWHNTHQTSEVRDRIQRLINAAGTTEGAGGGFLVPESLRSSLQAAALENSVARPRARVIPMETNRVGFPIVDDTSHVSSVFGGIIGYWTPEGGGLTESEPTFGQIWLESNKLTTLSYVNNELLTDSGASFEAFANQAFPEALAFYEDDAFLNGSGVGQPKGVLNSAAVIAVSRTTSSKVKFADLVNMYARCLPSSLARAVWVISPDVLPQLLQLSFTGAGGTDVAPPLWLPGMQAFGAPNMSLLGRPVIISEKVPALGAKSDVSLIDFGHYMIGDRMHMTASSSPHYKFATDQTAFKIVARVDGRADLNSAITPKNGGSTLSPFVTLAA